MIDGRPRPQRRQASAHRNRHKVAGDWFSVWHRCSQNPASIGGSWDICRIARQRSKAEGIAARGWPLLGRHGPSGVICRGPLRGRKRTCGTAP